MGKPNKKQKQRHSNHHDNPAQSRNAVVRRQHSQSKFSRTTINPSAPSKKDHKNGQPGAPYAQQHHRHQQQQHNRPKIPFQTWDRVLLLGEGDFSFSSSLVRNHDVGHVVATCFDDQATLLDKYPDVAKTVSQLDSSAIDGQARGRGNNDEPAATEPVSLVGTEPNNLQETPLEEDLAEGDSDSEGQDDKTTSTVGKTTVLMGIDATKLNKAHKKTLRQHTPFTKIVFNFPHVGGLSTDVNRQVRSNQQLLVGFFNAAKPLLATATNPASRPSTKEHHSDTYNTDDEDEDERENSNADYSGLRQGQILVTLFEGEPYTLWNIRDLARHCGLKVVESFRFPWEVYPGYQHARTIGAITTGKDRGDEGKRKGAWRGEERDARCYVLALADSEGSMRSGQESAKRKKQNEDSDSD